jgi:putative ABC transport system permease protein
LLVLLVLPAFNAFVQRDLSFNLLQNPKFLLWMTVLVGFIGFFAGGYPALAISSFRPVSILRGKHKLGSRGGSLRNVLVVVQFSISIILVICTLVVRNQLHYIKNKDVGYQKDQIVTLQIQDRELRKNINAIKSELIKSPHIQAVSSSQHLPNRVTSLSRIIPPASSGSESLSMYASIIDYDFIDLYGIEILEGRNFSRDFPADTKDAYLINQSAAKALGYDSPVGKEFTRSVHGGKAATCRIIGVVKDYHFLSLRLKIAPLYLALDPRGIQPYFSVKIKGTHIPEAMEFIKEKFQGFSSAYPLEYRFFDEVFNRAYVSEQRMGKMFNTFGLIAIFIACLGLFGLASFSTEQKTKEIGIRKVLGASVPGIVMMLSKEFTRWVLLANIIAWPAAYYLMNLWLQNFEYKASLAAWVFVLSSLLALMVAFLTVIFQTVRAAVANPVDSLKYE